MPDTNNMTPAKANKGILCSEIQTSCGTAVTKLASATPAPSETSNAGRAQQSKVVNELMTVRISKTIVRTFMISLEQC